MDTALERIRAKIVELESQISNLRIAERELVALETGPERKTSSVLRVDSELQPVAMPEAGDATGSQQSVTATITGILSQHGPLTVPSIAEYIAGSGRDVTNRAISFALQALKKRGVVKSAGGEWTLNQSKRKRRGS